MLLGPWDTSGLSAGSYRARLTLWVDGDTGAYLTDEFAAKIVVHLTSPGGSGDDGGMCFISTPLN
jgi:hypothetical protein